MSEKSNIRQLLSAGPVLVKFEKRDGSIREMLCTTSVLLIPEEKTPKHTHLTVNSDQVRVFDLDLKEWRSFNINNLIDFLKI